MRAARSAITRIVLVGLLALVAAAAATLGALLVAYPAEYVYRTLAWGDSDTGDIDRFPARAMAAGSAPFRFATRPDEARVRTVFAGARPGETLESWLEATGTEAFIVIHDDAIAYERYFGGAQRETLLTSFSVSKSFASALVGIAIAEGRIGSVADPVTKYVPELARRDSRFDAITLRDLISMSSGLRYDEYPLPTSDGAKTYYYPDLRALALRDTEIEEAPGTHFLYNNYNPLLVGLVLERATGKPVAAYLEEKLWKPLGMEFAGSWSTDSETSGFEKMESGVNAAAIDYAKLGRLYLRRGDWDGKQIVPAAWVDASTRDDRGHDRAVYYAGSPGMLAAGAYYGYFWWGFRREDGASDFMAAGNHGQYVFVSPRRDVIIVRLGTRYGATRREWVQTFRAIADGF
jgi:CubicO group peptidase (beta-lactamase class C family)